MSIVNVNCKQVQLTVFTSDLTREESLKNIVYITDKVFTYFANDDGFNKQKWRTD